MRNDDSNQGGLFDDVLLASCAPAPVAPGARCRIVLPAWAARAAKARVARGQYDSLEDLFGRAIQQHLRELAEQDEVDALYAQRIERPFGDEPLFSPQGALVCHFGIPRGPGPDRTLPYDGPDDFPPFPVADAESTAAAAAAEQTAEAWAEELFVLEKERHLVTETAPVSHAKSGSGL